jgi:uncharacterized protein YjbI with pentapeptide repeats
MTSGQQGQGPPCPVGDCRGVQAQPGAPCLAHCDDTELEITLRRLAERGSLDARRTRFTSTLLARILYVLPQDESGRPIFRGTTQFNEATFEGSALFGSVTFEGEAFFSGARFMDLAGFDKATFKSQAVFGGAIFRDGAVFSGATFQDTAGFDKATFKSQAVFSEVTFKGEATFDEAIFDRGAGFDEATFEGWARFENATFKDGAIFRAVTFKDWALFDKATLRGAFFSEATFKDWAVFYKATFTAGTLFDRATFEDRAVFWEAAFADAARFDRATFKGEAEFDRTSFGTEADFAGASFAGARQLGPLLATDLLRLDEAVFHRRIQIEVAATSLACRRVRFLAGVHLRVRWAMIELDDAELAEPSVISGAPAFDGLNEYRGIPRGREQLGPPRPDGRPWIASLRGADVAGLAVADVDLQACWFAGAHNLDRLRVESPKVFATTPGWFAVETGWAWPPAWWWTRRQALAEEHAWRATSERGIRQMGWHTSQTWPVPPNHWVLPGQLRALPARRWWTHAAPIVRDWRHTARRMGIYRVLRTAHLQQARDAAARRRDSAREIANLYRALRKGREDNKDEPGAADFYYGEMELRRKAIPPSAERVILSTYWLVSGYGLRAWRALAALLIILALFGWLMVTFGFQQLRPASGAPLVDTSFVDAMLDGARTAIGLARTSQASLTNWGELFQVLLRLTVPVLLGLVVLSVRGRVKR